MSFSPVAVGITHNLKHLYHRVYMFNNDTFSRYSPFLFFRAFYGTFRHIYYHTFNAVPSVVRNETAKKINRGFSTEDARMSLPALKGGVSWQALQTPQGSFCKEIFTVAVYYHAF
jgi:hypothetical protein